MSLTFEARQGLFQNKKITAAQLISDYSITRFQKKNSSTIERRKEKINCSYEN